MLKTLKSPSCLKHHWLCIKPKATFNMSLIFPIKPNGNCATAPCSGTDVDLDLCPRDRQGLTPTPHPAPCTGTGPTDAGDREGTATSSRHRGCCNFLLVYNESLLQHGHEGEAGIETHFESQLYLGLNHSDCAIYTFPPLRAVHKASVGPSFMWGYCSGMRCQESVSWHTSEQPGAPPSAREMDSW